MVLITGELLSLVNPLWGLRSENSGHPINRKILTDRPEATGSSELLLIEPFVDELATGRQPGARIMRRRKCEGDLDGRANTVGRRGYRRRLEYRAHADQTRRLHRRRGRHHRGPLLGVLAVYLTSLTASGGARYLVDAMWMAVLVAPMAIILSLRSVTEQDKSDGVIATLARRFEAQARGQKFESRLANALDMAEGEPRSSR